MDKYSVSIKDKLIGLRKFSINKVAADSFTFVPGATPQMLWKSWPFRDIDLAPKQVGLTLPNGNVFTKAIVFI